MSRLYRVCALTLIAFGAWLIAASSVLAAATVTTTLAPGALTISPATVQLSYRIPAGTTERVALSSFSVTVTDATGAGAGWQIRAASVGAIGPQGAMPGADHAIIDFTVADVNGTAPDPTCVCDTIPSSFGTILQTPAQTGVGKSTEIFTTQLTVPDGAPAGRYAATLVLNVASLGAVSPLPGVRPPAGPAPPRGPTPPPLPVIQPAPAGPSSPSTPSPLPAARPGVPPQNPPSNTTARQTATSVPGSKQQTGTGAQGINTAPTVAATTGNEPVQSTVAPPNAGRIMDETAAPVSMNAAPSAVVPAALALPTVVASPVAPGTTGAAPAGNSPIAASATANATIAAQRPFPVVTLIGNAVTFAPSLITGDQNGPGESVNWHLQATYTLANHAAISRVFGGDARDRLPMRLSGGKVFIVMTGGGLGQATVAFDAQQPDSERAVMEPPAAVVTISIVAGP